MSKLYKCAKNCGSIEETSESNTPVCCGVKMVEIDEEDIFSCPGCAGCHMGCDGLKDEGLTNREY
jgi:hypothetical protein